MLSTPTTGYKSTPFPPLPFLTTMIATTIVIIGLFANMSESTAIANTASQHADSSYSSVSDSCFDESLYPVEVPLESSVEERGYRNVNSQRRRNHDNHHVHSLSKPMMSQRQVGQEKLSLEDSYDPNKADKLDARLQCCQKEEEARRK